MHWQIRMPWRTGKYLFKSLRRKAMCPLRRRVHIQKKWVSRYDKIPPPPPPHWNDYSYIYVIYINIYFLLIECGQGVSALFAIAIVVGIILSVFMVHFLYSDAYVPYSQTLGIGTSVAIIVGHFQLLGIFGTTHSIFFFSLLFFRLSS